MLELIHKLRYCVTPDFIRFLDTTTLNYSPIINIMLLGVRSWASNNDWLDLPIPNVNIFCNIKHGNTYLRLEHIFPCEVENIATRLEEMLQVAVQLQEMK